MYQQGCSGSRVELNQSKQHSAQYLESPSLNRILVHQAFQYLKYNTLPEHQTIMNSHLRHSQESDIFDMDVLKHEVKITSSTIKPYQLPGFIENAFKGNRLFQNAFERMDHEFKEEFYQTVKFFETDPTASNNPFYIQKYKQLYHLLANKVKQGAVVAPVKVVPIAIAEADFKMLSSQVDVMQQGNETYQNGNQQGGGDPLLGLSIDLEAMDLFGGGTAGEGGSNGMGVKQSNSVKNSSMVHRPVEVVEHKFEMPGAGSASIFDVDIESSPYDLADDEFGQSTKATIEPLYRLKNAESLGKSIMMNNVNLQKKETAFNINDLIDLQNVKIPETPKPRDMQILLNSVVKEVVEDEFDNGFSNAQTEQVVSPPRANIFELNLDDEGNEEVEVQSDEFKSEENNQDTENQVTTDQNSEGTQPMEQIKEESKNPQELEDDIYRSIEQIETQVVKVQPEVIQEQGQSQRQQEEVVENRQEKKESVDIFEMELEGVPQIERLELLPIQIIPFNVKKPQEQDIREEKIDNVQVTTTTSTTDRVEIKETEQKVRAEHKISKLDIPPEKEIQTNSRPKREQSVPLSIVIPSTPMNVPNEDSLTWLKDPQPQPRSLLTPPTPNITRITPIKSTPIPPQFRITTLQKWRVFYTKNNYECQIQFYKQLKQELERLEYFDKIEFVEQEMEVVQEIKRLSEVYSKCVDLDEEEVVHTVVKGIQKKIMMLNKEETRLRADLCIERDGRSLTAEIYQEVCSRQPGLSATLLRLRKEIEDPQKRLETFIQVALISLYSNGNILERTSRYKDIIQKLIKSAEGLKMNMGELRRMSDASAREVLRSRKFQEYISGMKRYYYLGLKVSEIVKLIEGQHSFRSRLNKLRIDLNSIYESLNLEHSLSLPLIQQPTPNSNWLEEYFNPYLEYLSTGRVPENVHICGVCFGESYRMVEKDGCLYHPECWNGVKCL